MLKKEMPDRVKILIGIALSLVVWGIGVLASGEVLTLYGYDRFGKRIDFLCIIFPVILILFGSVIAAVCKRNSNDALFFGAYLFIAVPALFFIIVTLNPFEVPGFLTILFLIFAALAVPALSSFMGFFKAVYGNTLPVGISEAHVAFCIAMAVAIVLPLILYKFVKSK
ncbi:MAG: hypothetical protein IJE19_01870 [Clostridia bacterium]|nr:hypothetical protein [Clostridia bacterium]